MVKTFNAKILSNEEVAEKIFRLTVDAPELAENSRAGQFVQVKISDDFTLRRPLGIASAAGGKVKIFYRAVGRGTEKLSARRAGETLNILGALGNGYSDFGGKILLAGGGMGMAPLLCAAEKFSADVLIGGRTRGEVVFWQEEFRPLVEKIFITTDDGSYHKKGFVTDFLPEILAAENYSAILTCGPEIMMRGVARLAAEKNLPCEVSFEKRMACGLGACLSCSIDTVDGRKKVCKDGPIFDARKVFGGERRE
ncbi:MAG: dihydroorotate dehydrogenase electron transfer subunit [Selenomonadaceae bacterium]|nr:dihydroorotate dehydrogenase electron transfer subunit [Selenomonadaceae bacterium]MBQ3727164.1 dihydroorotate dehydrogenase electron transfer subunit [Selenomonadaceae bacterium]MBQ9498180.1 dihydroorotate dehydrogenase electron transfer subunit [Selenomonadaceae bacterium]